MTNIENVEIAPGYRVKHWVALTLDPDKPDSTDWGTAVDIFEARIRDRFLDPADELIELGKGCDRHRFGFAVLAIDFLVIETLQGFREGVVSHDGKSKELFTRFLTGWDVFRGSVRNRDPHKLAGQVYRHYRCALHHSGSTKCTFRVGVRGPVFVFNTDDDVKINRTDLHESLKRAFALYLEELRAPDGKQLRRNFKVKMDAICGA